MTQIVEPTEEAPIQETKGMVFNATMKVAGLYGQVKKLSPTLETGLNLVEDSIPKQLVTSLEKVGYPAIDALDQYVAPVTSSLAKRTQSLPDLRELERIAKSSIEQRLTQLQLGDMKEYCSTAIENAQAVAQPKYQLARERIVALIERVLVLLENLREEAGKRTAQTGERVEVLLANLKQSLVELSAAGINFVEQKYALGVSKLPESYRESLAAQEPRVASAVKTILGSPAVVSNAVAKADLSLTNKTVSANIHSLVDALKEVIKTTVSNEQAPAKKME